MKIREFGVEIWMNEFENNCIYNLAETCVESLTIEQLLEIAGKKETILSEILPLKMTYGAIEGSDRLRDNIAGLFNKQKRENVVVTHGAIGANALIHETLVNPGDDVISILPTYQQHYSIPDSYGANVKILNLREENDFLPDLKELESLINNNTKLIVLNNPNNPTGSLMNEAMLNKIAQLARAYNAYILCDEVYRGIDQDGTGFTASIADIYEKGISTGSMSKAFSLAGLRLGWVVGPVELIQQVSVHRDYNTISVGILDDHFATIALDHRDAILKRSRMITKENLKILDDWIKAEPLLSYIKPKSGTTALVKYDIEMPSREFCVNLLQEKGVLFTPGSVMDMEGYIRIGYANNPQILKDGLKETSEFLKTFNN
jgi:aspartate/methionine/tyrosine aminotransferase